MGCTKCHQDVVFIENKKNEIVNPYTSNNKINLKPNSILETLNNQIDYDNVYHRKEILREEEIKQLDELTQKIRANKRLLKILKKCQSRILGMQCRKRVRYNNLRRAETINLDLLSKKELPLNNYQIENFFLDNPPKITESNIKIIKSEPVIFQNNIIYIGEWDTNFFQRYGRGIQFYPDGSYYKGYWENDKAEGEGEFIHSSGDKYVGNWHDNKRHGKGTYKSNKGKEYEGYWKNDKPDGEGKEIIENGNIYIGSFSKGLKNGFGTLQMKNGNIYEGNFVDGKMNGKGIYTFNDKRTYEGEFVNNTFEGKGKYTWPNGNKFKGNFKKNNREGFGIFYFTDGKKYRGIWNKGRLEGNYDVYNPITGGWIKKKAKEISQSNSSNNAPKSNSNKEKIESNDADEFNNGQIFDFIVIGDIGEIEKDEEIKIDLNNEDDFSIENIENKNES